MTEKLLQYIWQFQHFNNCDLSSIEGEPLHIEHPGTYNTNQGPDFLAAKIKVANTRWAGHVELHLKSSDWMVHQHGRDKNYQNVILHVGWQHDADLNLPFPALELQSRVSKLLLHRFQELMSNTAFIACDKSIALVDELTWKSWKDRLLVERLQQKSLLIFEHLRQTNQHWEEVFWRLLAANFGTKVNSEAFEKIAQRLPLTLLGKHKNQIHQIEALLFGQAGLLESAFTDAYPKMLQKEFRFYASKYQLPPAAIPLHFLRMRPANFPSIRLAQLAMLIHQSLHLFATIKECNELLSIKNLLAVTANDYWHYHYVFDEPSAFKQKHLGAEMINNILINTVVPIVFAYGVHHQEEAYKTKAMQWLEAIAAEKNTITTGFAALGIKNKNAFDAQALLQLKKQYCDQKRCLQCAVGNRLLKTAIANGT